MSGDLLVTARYTFGPEHKPEQPYCWSCMSEKLPGTPMRTAQPPAPPNDFCPRCVEICKTPEKIYAGKKDSATSKAHPKDKVNKKHRRVRRGILPEEE